MTIRQLRELLDSVPEFMLDHPVMMAVGGVAREVGGMGLTPPKLPGGERTGMILFDEVTSLPALPRRYDGWFSGQPPT